MPGFHPSPGGAISPSHAPTGRDAKGAGMNAEHQAMAEQIEQSLGLLRRSL
jgi:hypothetical protein